jgi:hypothetical protein
MKRTTIRSRLYTLVVVFVLVFGAFATLARLTLSYLQVNGPLYQGISQQKDLLADILPPPVYLIETYLVALQLSTESDADLVKQDLAKLESLKKDYNDRHVFWETNLADSPVRTMIIEESYKPALAFFQVIDQEFLPAIVKQDHALATSLVHGKLYILYAEHRKAIDHAVTAATSNSEALETQAQGVIRSRTWIMAGITIGGLAGISMLSIWIVRVLSRGLNAIAAQLNNGSSQVASASSQVAAASQSLAEGASEQASSLEETSASLEEMSSMTERNADSAESAKTLASETRAAADAGAKDMEEMSSAMADVKAASDNIAKIIKTIDEIAFQTNILALNAAVEAARAGEAGAGFAVVADEVRSLAQRSAQAAKETAEKIENSIQKSHRGAQISEKVTASLSQIVVKARQVDELVGEIAAASKEQAQGIIQVNVAISQMDKITQSNAASAEESASASEELNAQAAALKGGVAELSQMVGITTAQIVETPKAVRSEFQGPAKAAGNGHNGHSHGNGHAPIGKTPVPALAAAGVRHTAAIPMEGDFKDF